MWLSPKLGKASKCCIRILYTTEHQMLRSCEEYYNQAPKQTFSVSSHGEGDQSLEGWSEMSWFKWWEAGDWNLICEEMEKEKITILWSSWHTIQMALVNYIPPCGFSYQTCTNIYSGQKYISVKMSLFNCVLSIE